MSVEHLSGISVPFAARRIKNADCVYADESLLSREASLSLYAYAVPSELESDLDYTSESAMFLAERYGGEGIGVNGGAGRCGTRGAFQIKGIGRTPLLDSRLVNSDLWHSHGGVALPDAMHEAVWGEVFRWILPFGAARIAAIICTGTTAWYEGLGGKKTRAPRALVIRQTTVRPAHFMRAVFYRPDMVVASSGTDVERVKTAMRFIHLCLPQSQQSLAGTPEQLLAGGLQEMVSRWAQQSATSQVFKLLHGAIYPSNISVDGRWVDFGTASSLPTHANTKCFGAPSHFSTLWEEHKQIESIIPPFVFYVAKYFEFKLINPAHLTEWLVSHYIDTYTKALHLAVLKAIGIPREAISKTWSLDATHRLCQALIVAMRSGNERRVEGSMPDLSMHGHQNLGLVVRYLALYRDPHECDCALASVISAQRLRSQLIEGYCHFLGAAANATEGRFSEAVLRRLSGVGGLRLRVVLHQLFRHNLVRDCRQICSEFSPGEYEGLISAKVARMGRIAQAVSSPVDDDRVVLWQSGNEIFAFSGRLNQYIFERGNDAKIVRSFEDLSGPCPEASEFWSMQRENPFS